tara:strand:+ start:3515 stop:3871 length:357 start_codon:yes stop_codon:yes gene_type:complete
MAHFAKVLNGIVDQVIVADQEWIDALDGTWIQTSYNTRGGIHYGQDGQPDDGVALRVNYAGIGYTYDSVRDAFYSPKPFDSWSFNEEACTWHPPTPYPDDGIYTWDEETISWVEVIED